MRPHQFCYFLFVLISVLATKPLLPMKEKIVTLAICTRLIYSTENDRDMSELVDMDTKLQQTSEMKSP